MPFFTPLNSYTLQSNFNTFLHVTPSRSESAASESGDFPCVASLSSYHKRRRTDLESQPLEELSEDQRDLNPQFEDELSMTTDAKSKYAIIIVFLHVFISY